MRDKLIHEYDTVDVEEVWLTVTRDLPHLVQFLERVLDDSAGDSHT